MQEMQQSNNTLFYQGPNSRSSRIIWTPSAFARSSLLYLQETGSLTAIQPHMSGRDHLSSYLFFVVKEGEGWLEYKGVHYELHSGNCCFISCTDGYQQSSSDDLWEISWTHFNSSQMSSIWNKYCERGGKPVFRPAETQPFISVLDILYSTATSSSYIRDVEINTLLTQLIGLLFAETVYEENEKPTVANTVGNVERIDVSSIKTYIDTHYKEPLTLELISDRFHYQKSYLAREFKERFGMSVGGYISMVRVGRAKELLRFSDMSVVEVGVECGYGDVNYFSRVFKKVEGVAPSVYRENWRSRNSSKESVNNTGGEE